MWHNIVSFQIPVDDVALMHSCQSKDYLFYYFDSLWLRDSSPFVDFICEGASTTVFNNHNFKILIFVDIIKFHDVLGLYFHHKLGLSFGKSSSNVFNFGATGVIFDGLKVKDFDSNFFVVDIIHAPVDWPVGPLSNVLVDKIFINASIFKREFLAFELLVGEIQLMQSHW